MQVAKSVTGKFDKAEKSQLLVAAFGTTLEPFHVPACGSKLMMVPPVGPLATN